MEETISKDNILISHKKAAQERRLQKKREKESFPHDLPGLDVNSSTIRREIR